MQNGRQIDLSTQVERVKRKTKPWKSIIALLLAIAAAVISHQARNDNFTASNMTNQFITYGTAVLFLVFGSSATYGLAGKSRELLEPTAGQAHSAIVRYAILLVGAFLRVYDLALKPLHHDEGVNGFFLQRLVNEGLYHYDPGNYHGPTLYYITLVSTSLNSFFHGGSGLSTVAVRMVPALFGVATIWLVLCLRRYIGSMGALVAAALLALSLSSNDYVEHVATYEMFITLTKWMIVFLVVLLLGMAYFLV